MQATEISNKDHGPIGFAIDQLYINAVLSRAKRSGNKTLTKWLTPIGNTVKGIKQSPKAKEKLSSFW